MGTERRFKLKSNSKKENTLRLEFTFLGWILERCIRIYQLTLACLVQGSCRFEPSCSNYGREAIKIHGATSGVILTLKRLMRCQPFCEGGYDPVPAKQLSQRD